MRYRNNTVSFLTFTTFGKYGLIIYDTTTRRRDDYTWQLKVDPMISEPIALKINHFYERYNESSTISRESFSKVFQSLSRGCIWVGLNPTFDIQRIETIMRDCGVAPEWYYSPIDMKNVLGAWFNLTPPWNTSELAERLKVDTTKDRHSALGDCVITLNMLEKWLDAIKK